MKWKAAGVQALVYLVLAGIYLWRGFDWWWYWPLWFAWDYYQNF